MITVNVCPKLIHSRPTEVVTMIHSTKHLLRVNHLNLGINLCINNVDSTFRLIKLGFNVFLHFWQFFWSPDFPRCGFFQGRRKLQKSISPFGSCGLSHLCTILLPIRLNEREIYLKYLDTDKIKMRHKVSKSKLNLFDGLSLQWFSQG